MKCFYLAGPLTPKSGLPTDYLANCRPFFLAEAFLLGQGYNAYNPARDMLTFLFLPFPFKMYKVYQISLDWIKRCDAMILLPGWKFSKGANMEIKLAKELGKEIYYLPFNAAGLPTEILPYHDFGDDEE